MRPRHSWMMKKAIRKTADMIQKNIISKKRLDMLDLTLFGYE